MDRQTLASSSSSNTIYPALLPQEDAWLTTYNKLLPRSYSLASSHQSAIPTSISRVNQVDAGRLDIEMSAMLKEQLFKVFSLMKSGMLFQYEPELDAFLEFLIWRFSIWVDKRTPGNALMNLRYRDERAVDVRGKGIHFDFEAEFIVDSMNRRIFLGTRVTLHAFSPFPPDNVRTGLEGPGFTVAKKIWYCVATVDGQYIGAVFNHFLLFGDGRSLARRAWLLIQRMEGIYKAASFSNLLIFLYTRRYRNLIERALRARLVYGSPHMNRAVSFEYMNHQLVWNEFSVIVHPLVECCRLYMVIAK